MSKQELYAHWFINTGYPPKDTEAHHSNGLVCFTHWNMFSANKITLVVNPSTHKFFNLPRPVTDNYITSYLFGFDESRNEHKILNISQSFESDTVEIRVFSLESYSWRKIDVDLPVNVSHSVRQPHRWCYNCGSVCVNSIVHLVLHSPVEILAFDLRTYKFSIVKCPSSAVVSKRIIKINGLLGINFHDGVDESKEMYIWILRDYEKGFWVRETIRFPRSWGKMGRPLLEDSGNTDEIIFSPNVLSEDLIEVPVYDMKRRCFKTIQLTLDQRFIRPEAVKLEEIKCYVESLIPLHN